MINWVVFVVLTVMHPIADFFTWNRGWGSKGWRSRIFSEYVLALNPLHAIWDMYSPLRRHPQYAFMDSERDEVVVKWLFWRWLAVDQLAHVLMNLFVACLVGIFL